MGLLGAQQARGVVKWIETFEIRFPENSGSGVLCVHRYLLGTPQDVDGQDFHSL